MPWWVRDREERNQGERRNVERRVRLVQSKRMEKMALLAQPTDPR